VVLLVLALLALGGGFYLGSYRYTDAPSVLRLSLSAATAALDHQGLHVRRGDDDYSETIARGLVLSQDPGPHGRVRKGGTVTLHLSKGPDRRVVPQVAGKDVNAARAALVAVGLEVATTTKSVYSQTIAKGLVVTTDPAPGARLKPLTAITLVISKGKEPVEVPNVTGLRQDKAVKRLQDAGFVVDVQLAFSDTVKKDVVIDQTPAEGTADRGSTVTLHVSKGPDLVEVPNVIGMRPADAERALTDAGFVGERVDAIFGRGRSVYNTDPSPGAKAPRGSTVRYFVN